MKYLLTGFSGFVSRHFLAFLDQQDSGAQVLGVDVNDPDFDVRTFKNLKCSFRQIDLLNRDEVSNIISQFQPDFILHLASFSSVAFSWKNPVESFANNTNIFLNLLEKVRTMNLNCRILSVGSSEEYGNVKVKDVPLSENTRLNPVSPYAVARVSQELLTKVYVESYGLDIVMTRSFNHIGPGQKDIFVVSSFARQMVEMKKSKAAGELITGDLSIVRDFLDVRDVVKAYFLLLQKGRTGEIYNVCSGVGNTLEQVIDKLAVQLGVKYTLKTNKELLRPNDNKIIIGDNSKLVNETGWQSSFTLEQSLKDIGEYWLKLT